MGLDMYLYKEKGFGGLSGEIKEAKVIDKEGKVVGKVKPDKYNSLTITTNVAYWRKANQIHQWFCELADGRDECQRIEVSIDNLRELKGICEKIKSTAKMGKTLVKIGEKMGKAAIKGKVVLVSPICEEYGAYAFKIGDKVMPVSEVEVGDYFMELSSNDETGEKPIFYKKLAENEYEVNKVGQGIANPEEIAELLPTTDGFYFGSTDYDEYYMSDIESTIEQLTEIVQDYEKEIENGTRGWDLNYYYQASW